MKFLAVATLIFCFGIQVFALTKQQISKYMEKCSVDKVLVKMALEGNIEENNPKLEADIECLFNKMKILNGVEIDKEKLKEFLQATKRGKSDQELQQLVDKCADIPEKTPRVKAFSVLKCTQGQ